MEEGLVEGLFILIVFVVVIIQSVAAQKKKQRQVAERQRAQGQSGLAEMEEPADLSEDLVPHEIWEEIAELAGGRESVEPTLEPAPASEPPTTWEAGLSAHSTPAVPERSPVPDRSRKLAAQLKEDATPASTSAPELQLEVAEGGGTGRLEWLFGGKDPEALRKAVLLREVLGPPLALREEEGV